MTPPTGCGIRPVPNRNQIRTDSDLAFCNSYEDGTSISREPRKAYETAEVGHSQLWAQPWVMLAYELLSTKGNGCHIM